MRIILAVIILLLCSTLLIADEHSVNFDAGTDFSKLKSFAFRNSRCDSTLPELNNSLYLKNFRGIIRASLIAKGLKEEAAGQADILIDFRFDGMELSEAERVGSRMEPGHVGSLYTQGTLNIDLFAREKNLLVWEGIYRDREDNPSRLARQYKNDAASLLLQYPPKKK